MDCEGHRPRARFRIAREVRCLRHAAFSPRVALTALLTALVVGTVLTLINQGTLIFDGRLPAALWWKIPLTYCVPYLVSTFSALRVSMVRDSEK